MRLLRFGSSRRVAASQARPLHVCAAVLRRPAFAADVPYTLPPPATQEWDLPDDPATGKKRVAGPAPGSATECCVVQ